MNTRLVSALVVDLGAAAAPATADALARSGLRVALITHIRAGSTTVRAHESDVLAVSGDLERPHGQSSPWRCIEPYISRSERLLVFPADDACRLADDLRVWRRHAGRLFFTLHRAIGAMPRLRAIDIVLHRRAAPEKPSAGTAAELHPIEALARAVVTQRASTGLALRLTSPTGATVGDTVAHCVNLCTQPTIGPLDARRDP